MTSFNQRFDPHFGTLRQRDKDGEIGGVERFPSRPVTQRLRQPPISRVKRAFGDMMIHDLDMARFRAGRGAYQGICSRIQLIDQTIRDAADVDMAAVTLTTSSRPHLQDNQFS
jgi:myo-inositol 2-dehydrogenase/D-chiro-inositol 1-dehydrogenase